MRFLFHQTTGLAGLKKNIELANNKIQVLAAKDNFLVAGTENGILISEDNGENWAVSDISNKSVRALIIINDTAWAGTGSDGVYVSFNKGKSWSSAGLTCQYVFALFSKGNNIFAGLFDGLYTTSNNGNVWIKTSLSNVYIRAINSSGKNLIAGALGYEGIYISSDNGINWIQSNTGLKSKFILALAVLDKYVFAGTNDAGIFISSDNGASWTEANNGIQYKKINCFAIAGGKIFAAGPSGVYISSNYGADWKNTGLSYVNAMAIKGDCIFAGTNGQGVFMSSDDGATWGSTGLNTGIVHSLYAFNGAIFVGQYYGNGVFVSNDDGKSWKQVNTGLLNLNVEVFTVKDGILFAGTFGSSVWQRTISEMITNVNENSFNPTFSLSQNYPNPFNPSTKINYQIPEANKVILKVFDVLGKEIATLVNEYKVAGTHSAIFNAENYASGFYIYKLVSGNFVQAKKLLLLK